MPRIQVVTDSACDIRPELADDLGIQVVPLNIRFGDEELVDRIELSAKEFWDRVVTGPDMPQTSAPSPGAFEKVFLEAADAGMDGVICINLSSKVSGTFQSACTAAEGVSDRIRVEVVDSLTLTMGLGLIVIEAAQMAQSSGSLDELVEGVKDTASRAHVYGVVDSLDFLRKGGRIGGASHLLGSLLSIKPVLEVRDGVVEVDSKQRTRARAIAVLRFEGVDAGPLERIAFTDGRSPDAWRSWSFCGRRSRSIRSRCRFSVRWWEAIPVRHRSVSASSSLAHLAPEAPTRGARLISGGWTRTVPRATGTPPGYGRPCRLGMAREGSGHCRRRRRRSPRPADPAPHARGTGDRLRVDHRIDGPCSHRCHVDRRDPPSRRLLYPFGHRVWAAYALIGALLVVGGAFAWTKRTPANAKEA